MTSRTVGERAGVALDRSELDRDLERTLRLYAGVRQARRALLAATARDALLENVCRVLVEEGGLRLSWIGGSDARSHALKPFAIHGDGRDTLREILLRADDAQASCPTATAIRQETPCICNDIFDDPSTVSWRVKLKQHGLRACAAFPVRSAGKVQAALSVYAADLGFFQDRETTLLSELAEDIGLCLDRLSRDAVRLEVEQTIRQERDFSDAAIASLPGVFYVYDQRGRFLRWNKNFETVTGFDAEEIALMHPLDFISVEDNERVASRIHEVFEHGESSVEASFRSKDGTRMPYHFTGVRIQLGGSPCLMGVGIDIAKLQQAEDARSASEARYRTLFQQAPDGIVIADAQSYYLDANESMCRLLGYAREDLIGMHWSDIVLPEEIPYITSTLETLHGKHAHNREWLLRRKDGTTFPAEVIATKMPDGNLLGMIRDITERRKAIEAMRDLTESLEQKVQARTEELRAALLHAEAADRVKSAFLATMSHELRTPLNSILGFTGIVLQGLAGPLTEEQTKQLSMVRGSGRHLLDLINDVLDLSKIEAGQLAVRREAFDLPASISRVLATIQPLAAKKDLTLSSTIAPELTQVFGDRRRLEQILLNLLSNAVKFTERGSVSLTAEQTMLAPAHRHAATRPAVRFRIVDTGMGIKPADLATLFQPFRQVDIGLSRQHEGTGLGLAICRRLAVLLEGDIEAVSQWERGSEFIVTLPIDETHTKDAVES